MWRIKIFEDFHTPRFVISKRFLGGHSSLFRKQKVQVKKILIKKKNLEASNISRENPLKKIVENIF